MFGIHIILLIILRDTFTSPNSTYFRNNNNDNKLLLKRKSIIVIILYNVKTPVDMNETMKSATVCRISQIGTIQLLPLTTRLQIMGWWVKLITFAVNIISNPFN